MQAFRTDVVELSARLNFMGLCFFRKNENHFWIVIKKGKIKGLKIGADSIVMLALQTGPPHAVAFPAMDNRQMALKLFVI